MSHPSSVPLSHFFFRPSAEPCYPCLTQFVCLCLSYDSSGGRFKKCRHCSLLVSQCLGQGCHDGIGELCALHIRKPRTYQGRVLSSVCYGVSAGVWPHEAQCSKGASGLCRAYVFSLGKLQGSPGATSRCHCWRRLPEAEFRCLCGYGAVCVLPSLTACWALGLKNKPEGPRLTEWNSLLSALLADSCLWGQHFPTNIGTRQNACVSKAIPVRSIPKSAASKMFHTTTVKGVRCPRLQSARLTPLSQCSS